MVATRCIKCTAVVLGGGQFCDRCTPPAQLSQSPALETGRSCSACNKPTQVGVGFCSFCGHELAADVRYIGFWLRFVAYMIDWTIVGVATSMLFVVAYGSVALLYLSFLLSLGYYAGFESRFGATPGKMVFGVRVRMLNGDPITVKAGVLRYIGHFVSATFLGIGFLMIPFTKQKRGLHDYMAGTVVIKERRKSVQPTS